MKIKYTQPNKNTAPEPLFQPLFIPAKCLMVVPARGAARRERLVLVPPLRQLALTRTQPRHRSTLPSRDSGMTCFPKSQEIVKAVSIYT